MTSEPAPKIVSSFLRLSARTNIAILMAGFAAGQGALFISQSFLIASKAFELTVTFSLAFALAVLGTLLVDGGGIVLLARKYVTGQDRPDHTSELARYHAALVVIRLVVWTVITLGVVAFFLLSEGASRYYLLPATLGLIFWCFNSAGVLDGLSLSGLSGVAAAVPFLLSAAVLPFLVSLPINSASFIAGVAYGIGTALSAVLQWLLLRRSGYQLQLARPRWSEVKRVAAESFRFQLSFLPGQLLFRGQIMIADIFLPVQAAALFVYGKQAANAVQQIVGFARRASFPALIQRVATGPRMRIIEILRLQRVSLVMGGSLSLLMLAAGLLARQPFPEWLGSIGFALSIVAPVVATSAIFSALGQWLQATGQFIFLAGTTFIVTAIALSGAMLFEPWGGVYALVWAEAASHFIGLVFLALVFRGRV